MQKGQVLGTVEIAGGCADSVDLVACEEFAYAIAPGEKLSIQLPGSGFAYAPVCAGQQAGYAHIYLDGAPVGKVAVLYGETVELIPETKRSFWQRLFSK